MNGTQAIDAAKNSLQRVQKYLERLELAKGYHKECIHTFIDKDGDEIPLLVADLKALLQQVTTTPTHTDARDVEAADTIRLNWLDAQVKNHAVYNGFLWQEVGWESDRGLVCAIQGKKQKKTVRQAIDAAIAAQANKKGIEQ